MFASEADLLMDPKDLFYKDLGDLAITPEITLVEAATSEIMNKHTFVTIQETDGI